MLHIKHLYLVSGQTMTPALLIRMSIFSKELLSCSAHSLTLFRLARSHLEINN